MGAEIDRLEVEIEASASKANAQLDKLLGKLDKISGSLSGIDPKKLSGLAGVFGQSSSGAGKGVSTTRKLSGSFSQLSGRITKSQKSLSSFSQAAGKFYANSFLIIRGLKKLGSSIEQSMDYVETYNYFAVTMDKIGREFCDMYEQYGYDSAEAYANSFSGRLNELTRKMTGYSVGSNGELTLTDSIGLALDPQKIMDYQASIAAVTNSVGLCGETSTNTAKALTMLAADMSSLKNVNLSTAMTNFQSGLIGQSRALYKYGIDITNNTLQTYAYSLGLSKAVSEMTQAEKMQLRLVAILDQSKVAWGDQARTINSVANQYRILKQQVSNLARVIGNLFLPIVQKVLPVVNGLVIALQRLFTTLGFKLWGGNWLKDTMEGISGVGGGDALDDLADSADDTAGGLKDASKAAEKLKTIVRGIDELNIISPNTDTGSGSGVDLGTGGIDLSDAISAALADYEAVWEEAFQNSQNKAQEYADAICAIFTKVWNAIEPFRKALVRLWDDGLRQLAGYTFQNLKDFYNLVLVPMGMWAFGTEDSGLTRFVNIVNDRLMQIDWVWISHNLRVFWQAIEPYAEQFGEGLIDFFEDISKIPVNIINKLFGRDGAITGISDWLNSNDSEKARKWGYALGELAIGIMALKGVGSIISGIAGIGTKFAGITSGLGAIFGSKGIFASIGSRISGIFADGALFGSGGIIATAGAPIIALVSAFSALAAGLAYVFSANEDVRKSFSDAVSTIKEGLQPALQFVSDTLLPNLKSAWQGLMDILSPFGEFLSGVFTSIWQEMINPALASLGSEILPKLTETFEKLWNNVLVPLGELLGSIFAPIVQILSESLSVLWQEVIVPLAETVGTVLLESFTALIDKFNWLVETIQPVISTFQFLWNKVLAPIVNFLYQKFKPAFETVFKAIGGIIDGLRITLKGLIEFVSGVFTSDWEKAWGGVKDIFKGIFNAIVSIAESAINWLIDGINGFLNSFNSIVSAIGGVIGIDISIPNISRISLPRFAEGGYPETGQLFLARENGINELVGRIGNRSAVANNDQIVQAITAGVANGINADEQNALLREQNELLRAILAKDLDVQLDGRSLVTGMNKAQKRMGHNFQPA